VLSCLLVGTVRQMSPNLLQKVGIAQPRTAPIHREVANLIAAPTDMPPWLPEMLSAWAPSVAMSRGVHVMQPSKATMRKGLAEVSDAAAKLLRALRHTPTREFLELEGNVRIENRGGLEHALDAISKAAADAGASPRISAAPDKGKRGAGRALPATATSPKPPCVMIVGEIWKYVHGDYPGARNIRATKAAEAYWRASGGHSEGWGSTRYSGWRKHFEEARSPLQEKMRKEIHRHCVAIPTLRPKLRNVPRRSLSTAMAFDCSSLRWVKSIRSF
jgi:hypothetical protein